MPNKRKRTTEDRKRTRLARAVQDENPGMKYTDALREVDRRLEELLRADAVIGIDDEFDDDGFLAAGPDYPDPAAVLADLRQPPAVGGNVSAGRARARPDSGLIGQGASPPARGK